MTWNIKPEIELHEVKVIINMRQLEMAKVVKQEISWMAPKIRLPKEILTRFFNKKFRSDTNTKYECKIEMKQFSNKITN